MSKTAIAFGAGLALIVAACGGTTNDAGQAAGTGTGAPAPTSGSSTTPSYFTVPAEQLSHLQMATAARTQWERERLMFDLSGGYKINRTNELTLSCRNVFNQALESYFNVPGTIAYKDTFGAVWTLGVRGRF